MEIMIEDFCNKTKFPNLEETSQLIINHTISALKLASEKANIDILFVDFDHTCSVGRHLALPGSDLDQFTVIIGNSSQQQIEDFYGMFISLLDPNIIDIDGISKNLIIPYSALLEFGNDSNYIHPEKSRYVAAALSFLHNQDRLLFNLDNVQLQKLKNLKLFQKDINTFLDKSYITDTPKLKLKKRIELSETFFKLTTCEQYAVIQIIQSFQNNQYYNLLADTTNPNYLTLNSLLFKGILNYDIKNNTYIAYRLPTSKNNIFTNMGLEIKEIFSKTRI